MSTPTSVDLLVLKRAVRYLVGKLRIVQVFKEQERVTKLDADADSNWTQDPIDRESIRCLHLKRGAYVLRASVVTQTVWALSSGKAEYLANVEAASAAIGLRAVCPDLGIEIKLIILGSNSSAAGGILGRIELCKIRHWDTSLPRVQHYVQQRLIRLKKLYGKFNPADLGAKELNSVDMWKCPVMLNFEKRDGRHPLASVTNLAKRLEENVESERLKKPVVCPL